MGEPSSYPAPVLVGDHLAMDFLNSIENPASPITDCLGDGRGLIRWLEEAKVISAVEARSLRDHDAVVLDEVAQAARELREWFRGLFRHDIGLAINDPDGQLRPLNAILASDDSYGRLLSKTDKHEEDNNLHLAFERVSRWTSPDQMLQPLAMSIVRLLTEEDLSLVRNCEGPTCTLMFLDRTKSHKRRWCSMAVCGNRAKVAAHRARAAGRSD